MDRTPPPLKPAPLRRALALALLMGGAALLGVRLQPTRRLADARGPFSLDAAVPRAFGGWRQDAHRRGAIVNPQTEALLRRLYTETLERVYTRGPGERIMLSIAYGADQSDPGLRLHQPEVCYPAQGFELVRQWPDTLDLPMGRLPLRRLDTRFSTLFREPVSYWTVVGDHLARGGWDTRLAGLRHGLRGEIVDGMLVRVSSISDDPAAAFALQDQFVRDLLQNLKPADRRRLAGLP